MALAIRRRIVLGLARRKIGTVAPQAATLIETRTQITDHDAFGHMTNSRYTAWAEIARQDWAIRTGLIAHIPNVPRGRLVFSVVQEDGLFLKALRRPQPFTVATRCVGRTGTRFAFECRFERRDTTAAIFTTRADLAVGDPQADLSPWDAGRLPAAPMAPAAGRSAMR